MMGLMDTNGAGLVSRLDRSVLNVSNAFGYYLTPLAWIGSEPRFDDVQDEIAHLGIERFRTTLFDGTTVKVTSVKVTSDGLFMFDFTDSHYQLAHDGANFDWETADEKIGTRIQILDAHLASLYTAASIQPTLLMQKMYITYEDLILAETLDAPTRRFAGPAITALVISQDRRFYTAIPSLNNLGSMGRGHTLDMQRIEYSFRLLSEVLSKGLPNRALRFAENLLRACVALENDDAPTGIINAWSIVEDYLVFVWHDVMRNGIDASKHTPRQKQQAERWKQEFDTNGETPQFTPLLEFLVREGRIDAGPEADLRKMHAARSNWLHRGVAVDDRLASETMSLATTLLQTMEGVPFHFALSSSRSY